MKKVLFILAAGLMSFSVAFAQVDDKAAKKAAKEAAKALKKEKKEAQKNVKEASALLFQTGGNINEANRLINIAMTNKHTMNDPQTWNVAGLIQKKFYDQQNEKMYLQQQADTATFYKSLANMCSYFVKCDELAQIPNEKGKVQNKFRDANREMLYQNRPNLVAGGVYYFNKNKNEEAFELFSNYLDLATAPMLAQYNLVETDSFMYDVAYYATLAALKMEDYNKALKYIDVVKKNKDEEVALKAVEYEAMSYINLKDTANWLKTLKMGVEKYPEHEYFYSNLISYYNNSNQNEKLMEFANNMIAKNPLPIFRFVKAFLYQNMKKYDEAIAEYNVCIEQDPAYTGAYRNLAICYCQMAQDLSDATIGMKPNSKEYKAEQEKIKGYYRLAMPAYEKLRSLDDGTDPDVRQAWVNGLYTCYYMLNMGKEFEEIEKLIDAK